MNFQSDSLFQLETDRLILCELSQDDAAFMLELINDPDWIRFIGDRGIRTLEEARNHIIQGPIASYTQHGFGLYLTKLKEDSTPIGICGLVNREGLDDVDLGFAFLPAFRTKGYGLESASAIINHAKDVLQLKRLAAVTDPENVASIKLLEKMGFVFEKMIRLSDDGDEINLFLLEF